MLVGYPFGVLHHVPKTSGFQVGVDDSFAALEDRCRRYTVGLEQMHDLIMITFLSPGRDDLVQFVVMTAPCLKVLKPKVESQIRLPDAPGQS